MQKLIDNQDFEALCIIRDEQKELQEKISNFEKSFNLK